ncbi:MAG: hypothetical protein OHK0039_09920 [Bacteroidia bacterium]
MCGGNLSPLLAMRYPLPELGAVGGACDIPMACGLDRRDRDRVDVGACLGASGDHGGFVEAVVLEGEACVEVGGEVAVGIVSIIISGEIAIDPATCRYAAPDGHSMMAAAICVFVWQDS